MHAPKLTLNLKVKRIRRGSKERPGEWWPLLITGQGQTAGMTCPQCGSTSYLDEHEIAEDGTVRPSVECPKPGCTFHAYVKLDDWP